MQTVWRWLVLAGMALAPVQGRAVDVPWEEFKQLYRATVERELQDRTPADSVAVAPQVATFERADYTVVVGAQEARGRLLLSGTLISGAPEMIRLFTRDLVIAEVESVTGGSLIRLEDKEGGVGLLPDGSTNALHVVLTFVAVPQEDGRSKFVTFRGPSALCTSLALTLPEGARLAESPGIADAQGRYHLPSRSEVTIRYLDQKAMIAAEVVDVDVLTQLRVQGNRVVMAATLLPARTLPDAITLTVPQGAEFISSSLNASWVVPGKSGYVIRLPAGYAKPVMLQFQIALDATGSLRFRLPALLDNRGREGFFTTEEPEDGQIRVTGKGLVMPLAAERQPASLRQMGGLAGSVSWLPANEEILLSVERFNAVSMPALVLDTIRFFTAFEEGGGALSVLVMEVPAEAGPRLTVVPVAGADLWSLKVNGQQRSIYGDAEGHWVVPLAGDKVSKVELAFMTRGAKLGLQGRLETILPATGIPARHVDVAIALPARVELLAMEGAVSPEPGAAWPMPSEIVGRPHCFSRLFYKGDGMPMAISYKEPLNTNGKL